MKKAILVVFAVAILGALGLYLKKNDHITSPLGAGATMPYSQSGGSTAAANATAASYKDGTYRGDAAETPYGTVQIAVVISGGKITNVEFLKMPNDQGHSIEITRQAEPLLKQTALQTQSSNIDFISGATSTSYGFEESLQAALNAASSA